MTQFFQVLKPNFSLSYLLTRFMMTQFFQVLKQTYKAYTKGEGFMMTQFFQILKPDSIFFSFSSVL